VIGRHTLAGLVLGVLAPCAHAGDEVARWIERMDHALETLEYEGVFVYVHDGRIEAMKIARAFEAGAPREYLVSLTGDRRELVRDRDRVQCTMAGGALSVGSEVRVPSPGAFAGLAAARERYRTRLVGTDRVAGFDAVVLEAMPQDAQRYGYRLWLDAGTGMLLGSTLLDADGRTIEQLMFTQLALREAAHASTAPVAEPPPRAATEPAGVGGLPEGFRLVADASEPGAVQKHYLYSDGLASVSVYLEPTATGRVLPTGTLRRGAVNVVGQVHDGWRVVVVGDLPMATIERIAKATTPPSGP
jgi:sigma-E factor negative regulatory protein RseB